MSINSKYEQYLKHFGTTVSIRDLAAGPDKPDLVALRHDVDHDLDMALELAHFEYHRGIKSSYYLLDTEAYWQDPAFEEKILQLDDYGHEVGIHVNVISKWFRGEITDIAADLSNTLERLRNLGIQVDTVSAHGDKLCYTHQFINYWCFSELRSTDPMTHEDGLSAEGIQTDDDRFKVSFPASNSLTRADGESLPLWGVSMEHLGLKADAMHIPIDQYFTDSGGDWKRSPDPLDCDLEKGRHQVVMHPEHWRGPQKLYFFLSAPRSGSSWLAKFNSQSTPLTCNHEFLLNHEISDNSLVEYKRTSYGINYLLDNREMVINLLKQGRAWIESTANDYAEVNVYLHHFMEEMKEVFPDAIFIHLHRNPRDVVRSLLNRGWYETPDTPRSPRLDMNKWDEMGRIEKISWFIRKANEELLDNSDVYLPYEMMTGSRDEFIRFIEGIGIPVHRRLANLDFEKRINATIRFDYPAYDEWSGGEQELFIKICSDINKTLGYTAGNTKSGYKHEGRKGLSYFYRRLIKKLMVYYKSRLYALKIYNNAKLSILFWTKGCEIEFQDNFLTIKTEPSRHAIVMLGSGQWGKINKDAGWMHNIRQWYSGDIKLESKKDELVTLYCLMYNHKGVLVKKEPIVKNFCNQGMISFSFRPRTDTDKFAIALYITAADTNRRFELVQLDLFKRLTPIHLHDHSY